MDFTEAQMGDLPRDVNVTIPLHHNATWAGKQLTPFAEGIYKPNIATCLTRIC